MMSARTTMHKEMMKELQQSSLLDAGNAAYLEQLYGDYLKNPASIPMEWCQYFEQLPRVNGEVSQVNPLDIEAELKEFVRHPHLHSAATQALFPDPLRLSVALREERKQIQVLELINAYRLLGHLHADIDPLKRREKPLVPELMLSYYHLSSEDLKLTFEAGSLPGAGKRTLEEILKCIKQLYCGTIASEFMHITDSPERIWVQEQVEKLSSIEISPQTKKHILERLSATEGLEKYLGSKYPGAKRFSIEGTDSLMVILDTLIQEGGVIGAKEIIMCMAHRGRLNVLVNLLGKKPSQLFDEFEGKHYDVKLESGDVKYHQGFSAEVSTLGGDVHLSLAFNPSHLEIVTPVASGSVKARQERRQDLKHEQVLAIAMHGDASFAGQGVVMEALNMAHTRGFTVGGTIHIIINNQIGFTTSNPSDARSTLYCSDIGKMMGIPIFHVNADDPEAVFLVAHLALKYREKFKKDVIIDLVGYRRQGHNEADEPAATQPLMYKIIRQLPTVYQMYSNKLMTEKTVTKEEIENLAKEYRDSLDTRGFSVARNLVNGSQREFLSDWSIYTEKDWRVKTKTSVDLDILKRLAEKQTTLPSGFLLHPRIEKIIQDRRKMAAGELPIDWGYAETLAYATLLSKDYLVRLSGQDSGRGTFFHRHVKLHDQNTDNDYIPLCHLSEKQGEFTVVDSLLSEAAVLAFEYGYSNTEPRGLIIWEAQFGDFANGAQVVIDQFISSGEQKWGRLCGLTLFLPHGYEGQGAEHSSSRLERYLQLCAENNIQVCNPSTPAQVFHMLRRQVLRPMRKPLIVMTPKSLLRHKLAVSTLQELENGKFFPVLPELDTLISQNVKRVVLCAGKIYYDLLEKRRADNRQDIAIIRIEQLYPFPDIELKEILKNYEKSSEIVWCQEEPRNQGAWYSIQHHLSDCLLKGQVLSYVGRQASAAPAVGYSHLHQEQQNALINDALS